MSLTPESLGILYEHVIWWHCSFIKSNQIYISPADTMSYLGLMQHAIIYCTNKILMTYGDLYKWQ
jgi:hypothetical protein